MITNRQLQEIKKIWYQLNDKRQPRRIWLVISLFVFGGTLMVLPFSTRLLYAIVGMFVVMATAVIVFRFLNEARYMHLVHQQKNDQIDEVIYVSDSKTGQ